MKKIFLSLVTILSILALNFSFAAYGNDKPQNPRPHKHHHKQHKKIEKRCECAPCHCDDCHCKDGKKPEEHKQKRQRLSEEPKP